MMHILLEIGATDAASISTHRSWADALFNAHRSKNDWIIMTDKGVMSAARPGISAERLEELVDMFRQCFRG